jgi:dTDP-4-amino-4,6-dideoxygalactose transaminase
MSVSAMKSRLQHAERNDTLPDVVVPVHFAGLPCDLKEIRDLADSFGFKILEDASHATGATYLGSPVGSLYADVSVFSFHAGKILTTAEGGMVTTRDREIAKRLQLLRSHGITRDTNDFEHAVDGPWSYEQLILGFNYRLTELQAALGLSQLSRLESMHERRIAAASLYDELLAQLPVIRPAKLPDRTSAWHLYVVEIDEKLTSVTRSKVFSQLREAGIGVNVHYIPIHTQPFFRKMGFSEGDCPAAEHYYGRALSLPLFPRLTPEEQSRVATLLGNALGA